MENPIAPNTKIRILSPEHRIRIRELALEAGYRDFVESYKYAFFREDVVTGSNQDSHFINHEYKEIFIELPTERKPSPTMEQGQKHDTDKPRYDLMPVHAEAAVVDVLTFGARKYSSYDIIPELRTIGEIELVCNAITVTKGIKSRSSQQESVSHAQTREESMTMAYASTATRTEKFESKKQESAGAVTTNDSRMKIQNTNKDKEKTIESGSQKTRVELKSTELKDLETQLLGLGIKRQNGMLCYRNTELIRSSMTVWLKEGVICAEEKTASHTLITATKQEGLEGFFAVGATTDLECLEIIYRVLRELSLISDKRRESHYSGANNWRHVESASERYTAAALRHIAAYRMGEHEDKESGLPHLAHAACCLMFMLELDSEADK